MPLTNFPNGVTSFGVPVLGNLATVPTGNVWWVHYSRGIDAAGRGDSPDNPLKTLDYAVGLASADNGDVIILLPGHAETIVAAGGVTIDKAGLTIVGLGVGTRRPTFSFTTATTATFLISANNTYIENLYFDLTGIDNLATGISVTGTYAVINNCEFLMSTSSNTGADAAISFSAAATRITIQKCRFDALPGSSAVAAVFGVGATNHVEVSECLFLGDFSTAAINNTTAAWTNVYLCKNRYRGTNASEPIIELHASATGIICENYSGVATMATSGSIVADGAYKFQNYVTDTLAAAASSGILDPVGVTL